MADRRSASQAGSEAASDAESEASEALPLERAVAVVLTPPQPDPGLGSELSESLVRCINGSARWVLSGAKPGNGIECLLDDSLETWWQSDGKAPHTVQAVFDRRTTVVGVAMFVEYGADESYTPNKVAIRAGMAAGLTTTIREVTLEEPSGWVWIPLALPDPDADLTMPRGVRTGDRSRVGRASSSGEVHCFPFGLKPLRCHVVEVILRQPSAE
ncbi:hypothetical protein FNF28_01744 [Cafeteria roenbergensis]|uniref:DOC domain-containing protein n=1 Tax=Cafeteria roenbergensis TaxID=33653 RepID=A0A5A8DZ36_CAFRO|nr:hypothetical protein FNF28_01744 [Cafeteria roenbergensis]